MAQDVVFDKTRFWGAIESNATNLISSTEKYLASEINNVASTTIKNSTDELLKVFKKNVNVVALDGSAVNLPDEVYEVVMNQVVEVESPKISGSGANVVNAMSRYISELLDPNTKTITVNGTKYTISNYLGSTEGLVSVTANNVEYVFSWSDSSKTMKSYETFMNELLNFGEETAKETANKVYAAIQKDVSNLTIGSNGLVTIFTKLLLNKDLDETTAREFFNDLKPYIDLEKATTNVDKKIIKILSNVYDNVSMTVAELVEQAKAFATELFPSAATISDKYDNAVSAYKNFSTYIAGNNVTSDSIVKSKEYKNFVTSYNNLESAVQQTTTDFSALLESYTTTRFADVHDQDIGNNNASISGTSQGDRISSHGTNVTVNGNDGDDTLSAYGNNTQVYGGNGADKFLALGSNITVSGDSGTDIIDIETDATKNSVLGGMDNDSIAVKGSNNTVHSDSGNDEIILAAVSNLAYGDEGDDVIFIDYNASSNTVMGGAGNDWIKVNSNANNNTVLGGTGNDTITLDESATVVLGYVAGDGNDTIIGFNEDDIINVPKDYSAETIGNDVIIYVGDNSITLKDTAGKTLNIQKPVDFSDIIKKITEPTQGGGTSDSITNSSTVDANVNVISGDSIDNTTSGVIINAYGDNARVYNEGSNVTISGGDGRDVISNYGSNVTISGGDGDDSIRNNASNVTISGGVGDDQIGNSGDSVTISAGDGNDFIYNDNGDSIMISGDDGNDYINNNNGDSIMISGDDGNDYIYNNNGDSITISGGAGDDSIRNWGDSVTISGGDGNDTIENNYGDSLSISGGDGNDSIYNWSGSNVTISGGTGDDSIYNHYGSNVTISGGDGNDSIYNYYGSNVSISGGTGDDSIYNHYGSNITISAGAGNDYIHNWGSNATMSGGEGNDIIVGSGENVTISGGKGDDSIHVELFRDSQIDYTLGDGNDTIIGYDGERINFSNTKYSTVISGYDVIIQFENGSITIKDTDISEVTIVNEANKELVPNENISSSETVSSPETVSSTPTPLEKNNNNTYEYTGGNKTITDYSSDAKVQLTGTISEIVSINEDLKLKSETGELTLEATKNKLVTFTDEKDNVIAYAYIANENEKVDGRSLDKFEVIVGAKDSSNYLIAGNNGSSLISNGGDNTLQGDAGRDVFVHSSGNSTVENFQSNDVINFDAMKNSFYIANNAVVLSNDKGALTIQDARDKLIDVTDDAGNVTAQIYVARESGGEVAGNALGNSPEIFKIIVGAEDNKNHLIAGDGGSRLIGGKTDDILQGGMGQDFFVYSSGNDTISGYDSWEDIVFSGTYTDLVATGNDLVLNAAEGSLRITDAKDKLIKIVDGNGNILMYVCMPSTEGIFDASTYNEFVVANGADDLPSQLIAGNGGSQLWGGGGRTSDLMQGGEGVDEFIYNYGNGHDDIVNAGAEDYVNLNGVTLNQIMGSKFIPNRATFLFNDLGSLNILGQPNTFVIDGQTYHADYDNNNLQAVNVS